MYNVCLHCCCLVVVVVVVVIVVIVLILGDLFVICLVIGAVCFCLNLFVFCFLFCFLFFVLFCFDLFCFFASLCFVSFRFVFYSFIFVDHNIKFISMKNKLSTVQKDYSITVLLERKQIH